MTMQQLINLALDELPGCELYYPFDKVETCALRHQGSGRWIGLILVHNGQELVNLKCDPLEADLLRRAYQGIMPAYHMNKTYWNSVALQSDVGEELLVRLLRQSYALTGGGKNKKATGSL